MALNINGTTGISGLDGSVSAPVLTGTDSNTGISFGSDIVNINTGGTRRINVNSSGQVGIGCDAGVTLDVQSAGGSAGWQMRVKNSGGSNDSGFFRDANDHFECVLRNASGGLSFIKNSGGSSTARLEFTAQGSERMRIQENGVLLIDSTAVYADGFIGRGILQLDAKQANRNGMTIRGKNLTGSAFTSSTVCAIGFVNSNGVVGQIQMSGSGTSFLTSSDYRLKENAVAISDGITRLKTLKPYRFNFKADPTTTVDGFFAHEVTAVPEAISGTKDKVDSDNNIMPQGIDQSKLVPLLTAALQEAVGKIETLETKVAALEAA